MNKFESILFILDVTPEVIDDMSEEQLDRVLVSLEIDITGILMVAEEGFTRKGNK